MNCEVKGYSKQKSFFYRTVYAGFYTASYVAVYSVSSAIDFVSSFGDNPITQGIEDGAMAACDTLDQYREQSEYFSQDSVESDEH